MMRHGRRQDPDRHLFFLQELTNANVAGDIAEVGNGIWAIHGDIPVDRDVILAEFTSHDQASSALAYLLARITPDA